MTKSRSGFRTAQSNWESPLWKYKLEYIETYENFQEIIKFWVARKGPAYAFLIKDPADHKDSGSGVVKQVDDKYYLFKRYEDDIRPFDRRITRPKPASVTFSNVSGTPNVNLYTGEVTGITSEGEWQGEFYVPVAFMDDEMNYNFAPSSNDGYMEWDVEVEEVRIEDA